MKRISAISTEIEKKLKQHGLRITPARLSVLKVMSDSNFALSHAEIQALLEDGFDRVTLYRILESFLESGLLHEVADFSGSKRFALCSDRCGDHHQHEHVHVHCRICQQTHCTPVDIPAISLPAGFKAEKSSFLIEGVCARCRENIPLN